MPATDKMQLARAPEAFSLSPARGDGPGTVQGYAVVYEATSGDRGGYVVRFDPGSMRLPADGRDVRALYNHDEAQLLGRTGNGTLRLAEDEYGVRFALDLPATQTGRDVAELLRRRDLAGMSFGTMGITHRWEQEGGREVKVYSEWELDEVTITGNPAFRQTSAQLKQPDAEANYGQMSKAAPDETSKVTQQDNAATKAQDTDDKADPRERFEARKQEAKALADKAAAENRPMSDEEREQFAAIKRDLGAIKDKLAAERDLADLSIEQYGQAAAKRVATAAHSPVVEVRDSERDRVARARRAYDQYLRTGDREQFVVTTGTANGALLPRTVEAAHVARSGDAFRQAVIERGGRIRATSDSSELTIAVFDRSDRSATLMPEDQRPGIEEDPLVRPVTLGAKLYTSKQEWYSRTELAAMPSVIDEVEAHLQELIDAKREAELAIKIAATATKRVTAAAADAVTYADLVAAKYRISAADRRRRKVAWFLGSGLAEAMEGLVDDGGRPMFLPSLADGSPPTLLGLPLYEVESFGDPATGKTSGCVASVDSLFVRDVTSGLAAPRMARYENQPGYPDEIGFELFHNGDSGFDPHGVCRIVHP